MGKLPNRGLTEAELDAIPVSDEEEAQMRAAIDNVRKAVERARIKPTLDWAFVMLLVASKILILQGMPAEYLVQMYLACWDAHEEPYNRTESKYFLSVGLLGNLHAKGARLRNALSDAKIGIADDTTVMGLVALASAALSRAGCARATFETLVRGLYTDGERAIADTIQAMGAKA